MGFFAGLAVGTFSGLLLSTLHRARAQRREKAAARAKRASPSHAEAHAKVWDQISGAMQATQLYLGDHLGLYAAMRELSQPPEAPSEAPSEGPSAAQRGEPVSFSAPELAAHTGLHVRWLREWCAHQAAMGVLQLLEGQGDDDDALRYMLPTAYADVLATPSSPEYDIAMVQCVPALVLRAKSVLPGAFRSGRGVPYDDTDVAMAIDRAHKTQINHVVIPHVLEAAAGGRVTAALTRGCRVAELGCGGGNLLLALAKKFPNSEFHGYEVSDEELRLASSALRSAELKNAYIHDAREEPLGDTKESFEVAVTLDVIHDAPFPVELISQIRRALAPGGIWLLADLTGLHGLRANISRNPNAATNLSFSILLCLACGLSEEGGAGLGALGFSLPIARRMLSDAGFGHVQVIFEDDIHRWLEVAVLPPLNSWLASLVTHGKMPPRSATPEAL